MTIQPMLPIGLLFLGFVAAVCGTTYFFLRNGMITAENIFTILRLSADYPIPAASFFLPKTGWMWYDFPAQNVWTL